MSQINIRWRACLIFLTQSLLTESINLQGLTNVPGAGHLQFDLLNTNGLICSCDEVDHSRLNVAHITETGVPFQNKNVHILYTFWKINWQTLLETDFWHMTKGYDYVLPLMQWLIFFLFFKIGENHLCCYNTGDVGAENDFERRM